MARPIWGASRGQALGAQSTEDLPSHWPGVKKGPHRVGSTGMRPSLPGVSSCNPHRDAGGGTLVIRYPVSSTCPAHTAPGPLLPQTFSQKRLKEEYLPPVWGGGGSWEGLVPSPGSQSSGAPGGRSRLKPPRMLGTPSPLLFSSRRHCFSVSALPTHALWGR